MGLLQEDKVIFYHPLNDADEHIKSKTWTGTTQFGAAKVSNGLQAVPATSPTFGGVKQFYSSAGYEDMAIAGLSSDKFVVVWSNDTGTRQGRSRVGTVSGTDVTWGSEAFYRSSGGGNIYTFSLTPLDSTHVVVAYNDGDDSSHGTAKVGTVSGLDITWGSEGEFDSSASAMGLGRQADVEALDSTHVVVAWRRQSTGVGISAVGTVSGTEITWGATETFSAGDPVELGAGALSSGKFVVVYRDSDDGNKGKARVATVVGTTISYGSANTFDSANAINPAVAALDSATVVIVFRSGTNNDSRAIIGTVSGTDITFGTGTAYMGTTSSGYSWAVKLTSTKFIVAYQDGDDSNHGTTKLGTVSGTDITFGAESEYLGANSGGSNIAPLSSSRFVVAFLNHSDSSRCKVNVGDVSQASDLGGTSADYPSVVSETRVAFGGWFKKPSA